MLFAAACAACFHRASKLVAAGEKVDVTLLLLLPGSTVTVSAASETASPGR